MYTELIFLINLGATLFLTGLIWTIQLVHYPSFRFVAEDQFLEFHRFHSTRISYIVIPVMIIELITSGLLWFEFGWVHPNSIGFYLVLLIWISTGVFSVPCHAKLLKGKNLDLINQLIVTNWFRTLLWSIKAVLTIWILSKN